MIQAIRMADVKATTACRTLTLEAGDLVDLLRVFCFFPEDMKHALLALSLLVPMSCSSSGASSISIFLVLIRDLVFTLCLQNHPGAKKKIIQSIEKRSEENKRNVQRLLDTHAAKSSSMANTTKIGRHQDAMYDARYGR